MKKRYLIFLFAALLLLLCGCGSKKEVKTGYQIYYLNSEQTKLNPREYHPKSKDAEGMVKEFLRELSSAPEDVEYQKPIPNDVEIQSIGSKATSYLSGWIRIIIIWMRQRRCSVVQP